MAAACRAGGFDVRAVRPPTVPPGTSRLRLVCHAFNTGDEIEALAAAIEGAIANHVSASPVVGAVVSSEGARVGKRPDTRGGADTRRLEEAGSRPPGGEGPVETGPPQGACVFVVGTDTGVGKTLVSALLARGARGARRLEDAAYGMNDCHSRRE